MPKGNRKARYGEIDKVVAERLALPDDQKGRAALFDAAGVRKYIKHRMIECGLSQYKVAELLGIPQSGLALGLNGGPMSNERIEMLLWCLDGPESPYAYQTIARRGLPPQPNE